MNSKPKASAEEMACLNRLIKAYTGEESDLYGDDWILTSSQAQGNIELLEPRLARRFPESQEIRDRDMKDLFGAP